MIDQNFYKNTGPYSLDKISGMLSCKYIGNGDLSLNDISTLDSAKEDELSFYNNSKYSDAYKNSSAGVILVSNELRTGRASNLILCEDPYFMMAKAASIFYPNSIYPSFSFSNKAKNLNLDESVKISENTFIHKDAKIGKNCEIGCNSVIGPNVVIGDNCLIADNVSIYYSIIGKNVKIYQGVKIGTEGFGFIMQKNSIQKIPQLGRVLIEDSVEIGSNSTIDRGSIGDTIISKLSMLDNLVHIAHNVKIGQGCIIAAMTGISGSTKIGNGTIIGGQVGISGHLSIGNNVKIAAKSGIMKNIKDNQTVAGYPSENILDWHRNTIILKKIRKKNYDKS